MKLVVDMKGTRVYTHGMRPKKDNPLKSNTIIRHDSAWKARLKKVAQFYGVTESELIRSMVDAQFNHLEFVGWKHTDPGKNE